MIHYHGTPISPREQLMRLAGRNFCISYAQPQDLNTVLGIGQSVLFDNGAFSAYTRGLPFDDAAFCAWVARYLTHPHWAVIPDVIDGGLEEQRALVARWPFGKALGAPVYHLGQPPEYLLELLDAGWWRVCLGSSGQFWSVGSPTWCGRMDVVFNVLAKHGARPWLHGLRMLGQLDGGWPLSSADSTNVAQNHKRNGNCAECMAREIDAQQPPGEWQVRAEQGSLL